jgi:hypothetical protein
MSPQRLRRPAGNIAFCVAMQALLLQPVVADDSGSTATDTAANPVPRLDARISCSSRRQGGPGRVDDVDGRSEFADSAEIHLRGDHVDSFRWESSLFRSTTGYECSIDDSDGLVASMLPPATLSAAARAAGEPPVRRWRLQLQDARLARARRGYDADHGFNCSIRLEQRGTQLQILPSCPALCGSRENFSALTVDLTTGQCEYEH